MSASSHLAHLPVAARPEVARALLAQVLADTAEAIDVARREAYVPPLSDNATDEERAAYHDLARAADELQDLAACLREHEERLSK